MSGLVYPVSAGWSLKRRLVPFSIGHDEMRSSTTDVSSNGFKEVVSKHRLAVLHFRASWNEYDKQMDSVLEEIESEHAGRIFIGTVDTDNQNHWQRCRQLRILNLPAIVSFANGKHMETLIGMRTKEEMRKKIEAWWVAATAPGVDLR